MFRSGVIADSSGAMWWSVIREQRVGGVLVNSEEDDGSVGRMCSDWTIYKNQSGAAVSVRTVAPSPPKPTLGPRWPR